MFSTCAFTCARAQTHVHITHISVVVKTLPVGRPYRGRSGSSLAGQWQHYSIVSCEDQAVTPVPWAATHSPCTKHTHTYLHTQCPFFFDSVQKCLPFISMKLLLIPNVGFYHLKRRIDPPLHIKFCKGQSISKGLFDVIVSTKKTDEIFLRIYALVVGSKK